MANFYEAENWRTQAACRDSDPKIFFPDTVDQTRAAKAVCARCPVRKACLEFAMVTRQEDGVWGGVDEDERRRIKRRRQTNAWRASKRT